ncbi:hypothetical protein MMPV_000899 [Pyropia vietnamensis]
MPTAAPPPPITAVGLSGTPYTLSIVRRLAAGSAVAVGTDPPATYTLMRVEPSVALPLSALHAEAATWAAAATAAPASVVPLVDTFEAGGALVFLAAAPPPLRDASTSGVGGGICDGAPPASLSEGDALAAAASVAAASSAVAAACPGRAHGNIRLGTVVWGAWGGDAARPTARLGGFGVDRLRSRAKGVTEADDVYALGVVLHSWLTAGGGAGGRGAKGRLSSRSRGVVEAALRPPASRPLMAVWQYDLAAARGLVPVASAALPAAGVREREEVLAADLNSVRIGGAVGGGGGRAARTRTPPSNGVPATAGTAFTTPAAAAAAVATPMDARSLAAAVREATSGEPSAPATATVAAAVSGLMTAVAASPTSAADGVFQALYRRPLSKHPLVAFRSASLVGAMLAAAPASVAPVVSGQAPFLSWVETTWARGGGGASGDPGDPDGSSPHPLAYCFAGGEVAAFAALMRGVATTLVAHSLLTAGDEGGPSVDRAAAAAAVEAVQVQVAAAASLASRLAPASDACAGAKAVAVDLLVRGTRMAVASAVRVAGPQGTGIAALEAAAAQLQALGGKRRGRDVNRGLPDSPASTEGRTVHSVVNGGTGGGTARPASTSGGDDKDAALRAAFASGGGWASGGGSCGGDGSGGGGGGDRDTAEDDDERAVRRANRKASRRAARAAAAAAAAAAAGDASAAATERAAAEMGSRRGLQRPHEGTREHHRSDTSSSTTTPTTSSADPTYSASNGHSRWQRKVASTDASSSPSSSNDSDSSSSSVGSSSSSSSSSGSSSSSDGDDSSSSVERRQRRSRHRRPGSSGTSHSADERRPSSAARRAARASSSDERSRRSSQRTKAKRGMRPPKPARPPVPPVGSGPLVAATPAGKTPAMNRAFEIPPHAVRFGVQVGSGGFGVVFKGVYAGETVAIKRIHAHALGNAGAVAEFQAEVAVLSSVRHPNIVRFVGACTLPPALMIVTEFLERGTLFDVLHKSKDPIGWRERRGMMVGLCDGMTYLHSRGLLHRDLKSSNLLLDRDFTVKVADFGLTRIVSSLTAAPMTGQCGTFQYMAPEVLANRPYTEKADVFSFGILLWELVARKLPFFGMAPMQVGLAVVNTGLRPPIPRDCPRPLAILMRRCWEQDFRHRPSFKEAGKALRAMPSH